MIRTKKYSQAYLIIFILHVMLVNSAYSENKGIKMDIEEYKNQTVGREHELPKALISLFEFEEKYGGELYSESFCLDTQEEDYSYLIDFESTEQEKEYRKYIKKFAHVDGTGGFVAFWIKDANKNIENTPIINYGSEGSIRIVAKNINEFLRILSFDIELMDGSSYKMKSDYEESPYKSEYIAWLKNELSLEPVKDLGADENHGESEDIVNIVSEAEKLYKEKFIKWHSKFSNIEDRFEE